MIEKEKQQILKPMFNRIDTKWYSLLVQGLEINTEYGISRIRENLSEVHELAKQVDMNELKKIYYKITKKEQVDIKTIEKRVINIIMCSILILYYEKNLIKETDRQDFAIKIIEKMKNTISSKSHDYAEKADILSNFKISEELFNLPSYTGIAIRMSDKISRIENITQKKTSKVKDESLEDTLIDLANYSLLFYLTAVEKYDRSYRPNFRSIT